MAAPRKLPPDDTLRALHADGVTTAAIAETYGCTPAAVSLAWSRLCLEPRRARHSMLLPWRVSGDDARHVFVLYLRMLSRLATFEPVTDRRAKTAWRWAARLEADGQAVHYSRTSGWSIWPKEPGDVEVPVTTEFGQVTLTLGSTGAA